MIALLFIGMPVVGGIVGGYVVLKFLFPIILILGVVLIVLYFVMGKEMMDFVGFSTFISDTPVCLPVGETLSAQIYPTAQAASQACLQNENCKAFDWKGIEILTEKPPNVDDQDDAQVYGTYTNTSDTSTTNLLCCPSPYNSVSYQKLNNGNICSLPHCI